jgi:hypothetical protein
MNILYRIQSQHPNGEKPLIMMRNGRCIFAAMSLQRDQQKETQITDYKINACYSKFPQYLGLHRVEHRNHHH